MILNRSEIKERIEKEKMISGFVSMDKQLNSNGFDITVKDISIYQGAGTIDFDNSKREIPKYIRLVNHEGFYHLQFGAYLVDFREKFAIPNDLIALGYTRSSLLRMGAHIPSAVWDAGFEGYGQGMLIVTNPYGINVMEKARVMQLVFIERKDDDSLYEGRWNDVGNKQNTL